MKVLPSNHWSSSKYRAKACHVDGIRFDSQAEGAYYAHLKLLEKCGEVCMLELQPKVYMTRSRILYKPDFLIRDLSNMQLQYIDVKGMPTPVFKLKKRLWKEYGPGILLLVKGLEVIEKIDATCARRDIEVYKAK